MSGEIWDFFNVSEAFKRFLKGRKEARQQKLEKKQLKEEKKKEIQKVCEEINRSQAKEADRIRESMAEKDREIARKMDRELEKARNELSSLERELKETQKKIADMEEKARVAVGEQRTKLYSDIEKYNKEKAEIERRTEETRDRIERGKAELNKIVHATADEIMWNRENLNSDMHSRARGLMSRIEDKLAYDEFCDYAYTKALIEIEAALKEGASTERYEIFMDRMMEIEEWVDKADIESANGVSSFVTIDCIKEKLETAFKDRKGCKFEAVGSPTSMVTIRITFDDCITTIKMWPDGKGGFESALVNDTPGVNDVRVHDEICKRYCRIVSEAAGLEVNHDSQSLDDDGIADAEAKKRKSAEERMKDTEKKYDQHRRERKNTRMQ